jgi:hypothetical protein
MRLDRKHLAPALSLILLCLLPLLALAATDGVVWLEVERGGRLLLDAELLDLAAGEPLDLVFALPATGGWRATALSIDGRSAELDAHLLTGAPGRYRGRRIARLLFTPPASGWLQAEINLHFASAMTATRSDTDDPLLRGLTVNGLSAASERAADVARESSDHFDASGRWLRLDVERSGLYRLNYSDLLSAGLSPGMDTGSFRLLGTGGTAQPFRLEDGGSYRSDWSPAEMPLLVKGGSSLVADSELLFYLPGADGFLDEFEAGADFEAYRRHPYSNWGTYYLTWGGEPGLRIDGIDGTPVGGETPLATLPNRVHRERNRTYSAKYLYEDGWAWEEFFSPGDLDDEFAMGAAAAGETVRMRVGFDAPIIDYAPHHAEAYLTLAGSSFQGHEPMVDEVFSHNSPLGQVLLEAEQPLPAEFEGERLARFTFRLPGDAGFETDYGYLLWYEIYHAMRPVSDASTPLELHLPTGQARAEITASGWSHRPEVWDLTDPAAPVLVIGGVWEGGGLRLGLDTNVRRRLMLVDPEAGINYRRPDRVLAVNPTPLRNDDGDPQMIVVVFDGKLDDPADQGFLPTAERFADWRRSHFPLTGSGEVEVVGISDIYANFGGGMQDLAALRNFLRYRFDAPGSRLGYVLLLGDTTTDYRNNLGRDVLGDVSDVLVPALSSRFLTEQAAYHYTTDDYFAYMDEEDDSLQVAIPDLAIGRLPAGDLPTAERMVDMVIEYERDSSRDAWRDRMVLATDDYTKNCVGSDTIDHTSQAENLVRLAIPPEMDIRKIYMCEWDCDYSGFKPAAQNALFSTLDEGVLIFNYVGHGGNDVLSDEQLLLTNRLPSLANDDQRFLFVSASCNVGKYDDTDGKSMSEEMLSLPQGGAIGTMASSALSSAGFNNILNRNFLQELFPDRQVAGGAAIGQALLRAKVRIQQEDYVWGQGANNERYSILGDPSLRILAPELQLRFDSDRGDTLRVGGSLSLDGEVLRDGLLAADFNGELDLSVRASADTSGFWRPHQPNDIHVNYHLLGPEIFRGRIAVTDGRFSSPAFFVPGLPDSALGRYGRIRAFADCTGTGELSVGVLDSLAVLPGVLPADDTPPEVALNLAGGALSGTPGMSFSVNASAVSGINLVGAHPQNAIFVEYVESGQVQNLTADFLYDLNSATTGSAAGNLPAGLPQGLNTLVASVADNLGNVGRDTLRVTIFEEGRADLQAVQPFPNPFRERCAISFELTAPARMVCDIYTLSGRRIRTLERDCPEAGRWALDWDGRDSLGDQVANGTYLYKLEAVYSDNSSRRRERNGALVRMRD